MKKIIMTATFLFVATLQNLAMHDARNAINLNATYNAQGQKISEIFTDPYSNTHENIVIKHYSYNQGKNFPFNDTIHMPSGEIIKTNYNDTTGIRLSQSLKKTDNTSAQIIFAKNGATPVQKNHYDALNNLKQQIHYQFDGNTFKSKLTNHSNGNTTFSTYGLTGKREKSVMTQPDGSRIEVDYWFNGIYPRNTKTFDAENQLISNEFYQHPSLT